MGFESKSLESYHKSQKWVVSDRFFFKRQLVSGVLGLPQKAESGNPKAVYSCSIFFFEGGQ